MCGCGQPVSEKPRSNTAFDHEPALKLRDVDWEAFEYIPHQHDPAYIDARCTRSHKVKTSGSGATTAGTDIGKIKKERKRGRSKVKWKWPKARPWPKRKMRS